MPLEPVTLRAPELQKDKVIESLYILFGQDYKAGGLQSDRNRHGKPWPRSRNYAAFAGQDDYEEDWDWQNDQAYAGYEEPWEEDWLDDGGEDQFDDFEQDAGYYGASDEVETPEDVGLLADEYDTVFASYMDARKRFQDLKLARGYLPVVALQDTGGGSQIGASSSASSPPRSPSKGRGKSKGKGKNVFKGTPRPAGKGSPKARAEASLKCLRCGGHGHWAVNCPAGKASSAPNKRPAPSSTAVDGMAVHGEEALMTFTDAFGHERHDAVMLDPGASAFVSGYGPFRRYVQLLESHGFPLDKLQMLRCQRKFQFGGDKMSMSHWCALLPVVIEGRFGLIQLFLVPGDTPMLCGRPIIESLGIIMDFAHKRIRFNDGPWQEATIGSHGEYLLSMVQDDYLEAFNFDEPMFELRVADGTEVHGGVHTLEEFNTEEHVFSTMDKNPESGRELKKHFYKTASVKITTELNRLDAYITKELHPNGPEKRILWEVYCGKARTSHIAESLGMHVERFSYETGWDFERLDHQKQFLHRLEEELPHEVLIAFDCKLWSQMQNLASRSAAQQEALMEARRHHHERHLQFGRKIFLKQVDGGRHAHIEQPRYSLSWKTKALRDLPGRRADFDQCQYGAVCLSEQGTWLPVKKATTILTTKRAVQEAFQRLCDGSHEHCKLEGHAAGYGPRTKFMEDYQPGFAATLAAALAIYELPQSWEYIGAVSEQRQATGELVKLYTEQQQEAVRVVQRLHRNLGHPEPQALVDLLTSRGASPKVLEVARSYKCLACNKYKKPNQVAPASISVSREFNDQVQADVFYVKVDTAKIAVMSVVDSATKFAAAVVVHKEDPEEYIRALERCWVKHFGVPSSLVTDEGRPWLSAKFEEWTSRCNVAHQVAPGEAHERLAIVERRHAVLRKAIEIYMDDAKSTGAGGVKEALTYVVPQLNATPTVAGFSPSQWLMGKQPSFPGDLLNDSLNPIHVNGNEEFAEIIRKRTMAKTALVEADADRKLRRALTRKYQGLNAEYKLGERVWFWRDAKQGDLVKIRWLGPARVVLREEQEGKVLMYWIAFKSQLIRCAPHHVRGDVLGREHAADDLQEALRTVQQLKSRGVTRYFDLQRVNKRRLEDVEDSEQEDRPGEDLDSGDEDDGGGPPARRPRLMLPEQDQQEGAEPAVASNGEDPAEDHSPFLPLPIPEPELPPVPDLGSPMTYTPSLAPTSPAAGSLPEPAAEPMREITPQEEPARSPTRSPKPELDPLTASLYQPATEEDFRAHRRRFELQETLSLFGPNRRLHHQAAQQVSPYQKPEEPEEKEKEDDALLSQAFQVIEVQTDALPRGWIMDEQGYIQLNQREEDYWQIVGGCLVRHHLRPRHQKMSMNHLPKDSPFAVQDLDPVRVTVVHMNNGKVQLFTDDGVDASAPCEKPWTGVTIYQLKAHVRKELAMAGAEPVVRPRQVAKDYKHQQARKFKKENKGDLSERTMNPHERAMFKEAKVKELKSFFEHGVWEFQTTKEADPQRTMSSRMILKWSKNPQREPFKQL